LYCSWHAKCDVCKFRSGSALTNLRLALWSNQVVNTDLEMYMKSSVGTWPRPGQQHNSDKAWSIKSTVSKNEVPYDGVIHTVGEGYWIERIGVRSRIRSHMQYPLKIRPISYILLQFIMICLHVIIISKIKCNRIINNGPTVPRRNWTYPIKALSQTEKVNQYYTIAWIKKSACTYL